MVDAIGMRTEPVSAVALGVPGCRDLHLAGSLPPPPRLAVVGSRAAHRDLRDAVEPVVAAAARRGWSVVSGGAVGIDGDAHAAALTAEVPQLAVLPCGPDRLYPPGNEALLGQIAATPGSGLLFAHDRGTTPTRGMFASRNAIVVALSDAVLVVEAAPRSGTMRTARLARRHARPLAAIAGSAGAAMLVAEGAHALAWERDDPQALRRRVDRWLRALARGEAPPAEPTASWPASLHWLREALAAAGPRGLSIEAVDAPRRALVALTEAQTLGLVIELSPGRWAAVR